MMAGPKKVLVAKKPEEVKPEVAKEAIKGTIHKPKAAPGAPSTTTRQGRRQEAGQVGEAVLQLGRRRGEEACRAEDARRHRRRRPTRLARTARRCPPWRRPRRQRPELHAAGRAAGAGSARARDHLGGRPGAQDVGQGQRGHQAAHEAGPDGQHQPAARPGDGDDRRRGNGPHRAGRQAGRPGGLHRRGNRGRARRGSVEPRTGGHGDGPRRPRQDLAAGLHPPRPRGGGRGRRHHAAHRRLPRGNAARHDHLPGHPGPRRLHGDARARRQGHRHRDPGRGRRRRCDAADQGSHRPRQGRRRAHRRGHEQDRQARRQPGTPEERAGGRGRDPRGLRR